MKCRACGYVSFEPSGTCGNCGAPTTAAASQPELPLFSPPPESWPPGNVPAAAPRRRKAGRPSSARKAAARARQREEAPGEAPDALEVSERDLDLPEAAGRGRPAPEAAAPVPAVCLPVPPAAFAIPPPFPPGGDGPELPPLDAAVIDRIEDVPEMFWAPDGAGLLRRAAALLVDFALLAFLLGLFLLGGAFALWREGIETGALVSVPGLRVAFVPVALLAVLLSLATHIPLHALAGTTPGKRLAGLEVRSGDGSPPTWAEAALRWLGAALVLLSGGVGAAWALFEPRRRGWADLLSRTMVVDRAPGRPGGDGAVRGEEPGVPRPRATRVEVSRPALRERSQAPSRG